MKQLNLNGNWYLDYISDSPVADTTEPCLSEEKVRFPVPGYVEDHMDILRSTPIHTRLSYNPLFTLQRYPQAGYVPDMALPNPVGLFAYTRSFTLDTVQPARLSVGGAQNTVSLWINGVYLGKHEGYSADFSFDIPEGVLVPGKNRITLAVSNNRLAGYMGRPVSGLTSRAANECTGGIYGDVKLIFCRTGLRDVYVTTASDLSGFTVHTIGAQNYDKTVVIGNHRYTIPAGSDSIEISAEGFSLWSPASPVLYNVTVTAEGDSIDRRFGIRALTVEGTKLYLNGNPFFFRGTCEHCYHPLTVHPTRDKTYYRAVIKTLKSLGFNAVRFHTYVPMAEYMEAADELGFVMEIETPNNTALDEWQEILSMCRRYTAPCIYSSGNEMTIDENYVNHLRQCAKLVHTMTDSLFSPMSAMRAIEYYFLENEKTVEEPFKHNPERLGILSEFCDLYNSYSLGLTSYRSDSGDRETLETRNAVYGKPLLSHEICIGGTYVDLSLKDRYKGSRIGDTELFTSVEKHLDEKGLLSRAPTYYKNSCLWQADLRKHCFELLRSCESFAGYDFLGDIDTHWHTFGYCVGMMNEFYELKAGETAENVRRYNGETILLADLPRSINFASRDALDIPIYVSHYGEPLDKAMVTVTLRSESTVYMRKTLHVSRIDSGKNTLLYRLKFTVPTFSVPEKVTLSVTFCGGNTDAENRWDLFFFPKVRERKMPIQPESVEEMLKILRNSGDVILFGAGPFASLPISYQISIAGRTTGNLATVICDHPLLNVLPHDGYCGRTFREMLNGGNAVPLEGVPYAPIIEVANTYKNALPLAAMFEFSAGNGRIFVCTLDLKETDAGARWLKNRILEYTKSVAFHPKHRITEEQLRALCGDTLDAGENENEAANKNDITMK